MSQQYTSLRRRSYKFIQNYEQVWKNIITVLAQNQHCAAVQDAPIQSLHKPRIEHYAMKLYTPLDSRQLLQSQHKHYQSNRIRPQSSKPKHIFRKHTECIDDLRTLQKPVNTRQVVRPELVKRPMSSFTKQPQAKPAPAATFQSPTKSVSQKLYCKPFTPPPHMTAFSYLIVQPPNTVHLSWNSQTQLEVASLTKIMTCVVVLRLAEEMGVSLEHKVEVGAFQASMSGTSADLDKGFRYTVRQLLYGLMLPSGNDASMALAVWGGRLIHKRDKKQMNFDCMDTETTLDRLTKRQSLNLFLNEMNRVAKQLHLKKTHYANPHGLSNLHNKSTAYDIATLCQYAMQIQQFRKIVSTRQYRTSAENIDGQKQILTWENTHRLLAKREYMGIKTGFTSTAGGCLASYVKIQGREFIIVVLKCKKVNSRFKDTEILKRWLMKKEGLKKQGEEHKEEVGEDDFE